MVEQGEVRDKVAQTSVLLVRGEFKEDIEVVAFLIDVRDLSEVISYLQEGRFRRIPTEILRPHVVFELMMHTFACSKKSSSIFFAVTVIVAIDPFTTLTMRRGAWHPCDRKGRLRPAIYVPLRGWL